MKPTRDYLRMSEYRLNMTIAVIVEIQLWRVQGWFTARDLLNGPTNQG
jgi:hypothetical protein